MAQLDIQRKEGGNMLWWIVGLVVLAALAWWVVEANDRDTEISDGEIAAAASAPLATNTMLPDGNAITDLQTLAVASSAVDLAGHAVMLPGAPVARVVSDKGFWIGDTADSSAQVFVVRGDQGAASSAPDGAVNAGSRVRVFGTVQAMPTDLTGSTADWHLQSTDAQRIGTRPLYVQADSVQIATP